MRLYKLCILTILFICVFSTSVFANTCVTYTVGRGTMDDKNITVSYKPEKKIKKYTFKLYEKDKGEYKLIYKEKVKSGEVCLSSILNQGIFTYNKKYKIVIKRKKKITKKVERDYTQEELEEIQRNLNNLIPIKTNLFFITQQPIIEVNPNLRKVEYIVNYKNEIVSKSIFETPKLSEVALMEAESMNNYLYSQPKRCLEGYADCSSFVWYAYSLAGINIGNTVGNTESELQWCEKNAIKVPISEAREGDLIFYADPNIKDTYESHYKHVTHVAMFKDSQTIVEMSSPKINYREKQIGAYEHSYCIGVYRICENGHTIKG